MWPDSKTNTKSKARSSSYLELEDRLKASIRIIPDFPRPGFEFKYVPHPQKKDNYVFRTLFSV